MKFFGELFGDKKATVETTIYPSESPVHQLAADIKDWGNLSGSSVYEDKKIKDDLLLKIETQIKSLSEEDFNKALEMADLGPIARPTLERELYELRKKE